ncbi:DUF6551 family protein (plasmid) [Nocardia sp. CA-129566]|uniref:DUF6551 family protein n=1 Tax=Nocardia sp. CA-129566 TaxID=3239976 RepID=UPI003D9880CC
MPDTNTAVLDRPTTLEPTAVDAPNVYIAAIPIIEMFSDAAYQRELDRARAKKIAREWDPRLVGVVEVSDRGPRCPQGRYALINGQHRWAAAGLRDPNTVLVANVHTGLSVTQEATLFHEIDSKTKNLSTWDKWRSRRAAMDPAVLDIEDTVAAAGLSIDMAPKDGHIRCIATLERIHRMGGTRLLGNTLQTIVNVWGRRLDSVDAPIVMGLALILHTYTDTLDHRRLGEVLIEMVPRQIKARAQALREVETGQIGKLAAKYMVTTYNNGFSRKLDRGQLS